MTPSTLLRASWLFLLPFLYIGFPALAEDSDQEEEEITEPAPEKAPRTKIGARRKSVRDENEDEEDREKELRTFLDRIEPQLAEKMAQHKAGQLELSPKLNQQLDEWAGKISTYKKISDEKLVERTKRVSVMIFALYDMGEEKPKIKPARESAYQGTFSGGSYRPPVSSSQEPPVRKPVDTGNMGALPTRDVEGEGIVFRGTPREIKALKAIWDRFLKTPENRALWEKIRLHKKYKRQILQFGVTRGRSVRLIAEDATVNFHGNILLSEGWETETFRQLQEAEKEILQILTR